MVENSGMPLVEPSNEPLVFEIDDETFATLKITADKRGISVDDLAGELLREAVLKDIAAAAGPVDT